MPRLGIPYDPTRKALLHPHLAETLFQQGSTPTLEQIAVEACRLAYYKTETGEGQLTRLHGAWARLGFDQPKPFHSIPFIDSQAFGVFHPGRGIAVIAFRGTEPERIADLGTSVNILPVHVPGLAGHAHLGFLLAYRAIEPQVTVWLDGLEDHAAQLVICGHSLGGAVAMICASLLGREPALLLTIGCPRVGDAVFADSFDGMSLVRIVNCCDFVTDLPPALLYAHPQPFTYITATGQIERAPSRELVLHDRAHARDNYELTYRGRPGNVDLRDHADHSPINYVRAFFGLEL